MYRIETHPILDIPQSEIVEFLSDGQKVQGRKGYTIAAALHQAGFPVHSHSIDGRNRSLNCGIGKCGACEMIVDGQMRRICITLVDGVKEVRHVDSGVHVLPEVKEPQQREVKIYKTQVAIIGAGPAGLACREQLNTFGITNLVIDNNSRIGGQFNMQTHQFFFFEKEKKFGGMRGFDIAKTLAGDNPEGILLNSTVWDILEGGRVAVKNIVTGEVSYVDAEHLVVATGAVPFMPAFENDDVPGVYTAAVFQKMMNQEHTLLGKRVLTVGAGNIGYLTSYQGMQAGATIKAIIEAMPREGGFPVQANRVRRLGIPIMTGYTLVRAIPNADYTGITGAVIAKCENFKAIPGTEQVIDDSTLSISAQASSPTASCWLRGAKSSASIPMERATPSASAKAPVLCFVAVRWPMRWHRPWVCDTTTTTTSTSPVSISTLSSTPSVCSRNPICPHPSAW